MRFFPLPPLFLMDTASEIRISLNPFHKETPLELLKLKDGLLMAHSVGKAIQTNKGDHHERV